MWNVLLTETHELTSQHHHPRARTEEAWAFHPHCLWTSTGQQRRKESLLLCFTETVSLMRSDLGWRGEPYPPETETSQECKKTFTETWLWDTRTLLNRVFFFIPLDWGAETAPVTITYNFKSQSFDNFVQQLWVTLGHCSFNINNILKIELISTKHLLAI